MRQMLQAFGPRFSDIAQEYKSSLPTRLAAMRDAAHMGAHEVLAAAAHSLAGGSASLGAIRVSGLCRKLEDDCSHGAVPVDWQYRLGEIAHACNAFSERLTLLGETS